MYTALRITCGLVLLLLGAGAASADHRQPGSLLLYPEFDNRAGVVTVLTVTNANPAQDSDVDVEFIYIGRWDKNDQPLDCHEFNRTETLTPNDTLTIVTNDHDPHQERGYVYVFAKTPGTNVAIAYDHLLGNLLVVDALSIFQFSVNAESFRGVGMGPGQLTDIDGDGVRDLDGVEYERAPDKILVPRFLGQHSGPDARSARSATGELLLINLTGGTAFTTTLDLLVYNDNEEVFSAHHTFYCWERTSLLSVSAAFSQDFLRYATAHAWDESLGGIEYGWFRIDGGIASSTAMSIHDPAFLAVYIEGSFGSAAADLPFALGEQDNGDLLPRGVAGDS